MRGQPTLSGTRSPWSAAGIPQSEAHPARQFFLWQENVDPTASRWLRPLALCDSLPWTDVLCIPVLYHPTACTHRHHVPLLVASPWSSSYLYTTPWIFGTLHCPHCLQKTSWWIQIHQGYWPPWHLRFWSPPRGRPELGSSATNLVARPPPGGNARALFLRTLDTKVPCGTCGCKTWKQLYNAFEEFEKRFQHFCGTFFRGDFLWNRPDLGPSLLRRRLVGLSHWA